MAKTTIGLIIYQVDNNGLTRPETMGINVLDPNFGLKPTWDGVNPSNYYDYDVLPELRYKVYTLVTRSRPSLSNQQALFTNKTVAEILADINS